jgi:hypothetical protein
VAAVLSSFDAKGRDQRPCLWPLANRALFSLHKKKINTSTGKVERAGC